MVVYVDDVMMLSSPKDTSMLWRALEKSLDYKDPEAPMPRYLGALYKFDAFDEKKPKAPRSMLTSMDDYPANAVQRFLKEYGKKLSTVTSPYLSSEESGRLGEEPGRFSSSASSHVATLLFLSRVARPDISVAVQRLCRVVAKWTTTHDAALICLYAYLESAGPIALHS